MASGEPKYPKDVNDNRSDQCNPNNDKYEGHKKGYQGDKDKDNLDNHNEQLNPNNKKFQEKKERKEEK